MPRQVGRIGVRGTGGGTRPARPGAAAGGGGGTHVLSSAELDRIKGSVAQRQKTAIDVAEEVPYHVVTLFAKVDFSLTHVCAVSS